MYTIAPPVFLWIALFTGTLISIFATPIVGFTYIVGFSQKKRSAGRGLLKFWLLHFPYLAYLLAAPLKMLLGRSAPQH